MTFVHLDLIKANHIHHMWEALTRYPSKTELDLPNVHLTRLWKNEVNINTNSRVSEILRS